MPKIKLCGMFRECDILYANEAKPDYVGFILSGGFKRSVTAEWVEANKSNLSKEIQTVGVFVNEPVKRVAEICKRGIIDMIQLHGDEDDSYILSLKKLIPHAPVLKAVKVRSTKDISDAEKCLSDYLLLDTYRKGVAGGTGESFDWNLIPKVKKPIFLAGGIDITNIEKAAGLNVYALDVSSGIETDGVKDAGKMIEIVKKCREISAGKYVQGNMYPQRIDNGVFQLYESI